METIARPETSYYRRFQRNSLIPFPALGMKIQKAQIRP